jgi:hypothetical protein
MNSIFLSLREFFSFIWWNLTNDAMLIHFDFDYKNLFFIIHHHIVDDRMTSFCIFIDATNFNIFNNQSFECCLLWVNVITTKTIYLRLKIKIIILWYIFFIKFFRHFLFFLTMNIKFINIVIDSFWLRLIVRFKLSIIIYIDHNFKSF